MAMDENIKPERKATGGTKMDSGLAIRPNNATTANTKAEFMTLLVAPHKSSPAMTSSMLMGVVMMASKVFW
jgi:hypothetical protein